MKHKSASRDEAAVVIYRWGREYNEVLMSDRRSRQYLAQRTALNLSVSETRVSRRLPREPEPLSRQKTVVAAYRGEIWRRGNWNVSRTPSWRPADSADSDYSGADLRKINVRIFAEFICNEIQRSTYIPAIVYHWFNFVQDLPKTKSSLVVGLDYDRTGF